MDLTMYSFIGLVTLVATSYITTFVFNIFNDRFYSYFHLLGGIFGVIFFYTITRNYLFSIVLTEILGIGWEILEWGQWKLILKKKKYKPRFGDTRNDLFVDLAGSLSGVTLMALFNSSI